MSQSEEWREGGRGGEGGGGEGGGGEGGGGEESQEERCKAAVRCLHRHSSTNYCGSGIEMVGVGGGKIMEDEEEDVLITRVEGEGGRRQRCRKRSREDEEKMSTEKKHRKKEDEEGEEDEWVNIDSTEVPPHDEKGEEDEWVNIDSTEVPPHDEIVKKKRKTDTEKICFSYPPQRLELTRYFVTRSHHPLQAVVRFKRGTGTIIFSPNSRLNIEGLDWPIRMSFRVELIHPKDKLKQWEGCDSGVARPGERFCSVEIPVCEFVHNGMVRVRVHYWVSP